MEIIVVDNGSTDSVVKSLALWPRVRVLQEERPGSYAARNTGIRAARGEVIAFTDSDCIPMPGWIMHGVEKLTSTPNCGLVAGRIEVFARTPAAPTATELYERALAFRQLRNVRDGNFGVTANVFTTRTVIDAVGPFDDRLISGGDREWGERVHGANLRVQFAGDALVYHPARASLGEIRRKMRRIASGVNALERRKSWHERIRDFLRLPVPPIRNLLRIWTNGALDHAGDKMKASIVAIYAKYVWSAYRLYYLTGGKGASA